MPAGDGARRRADDRSDLSATRRAPAAAPYRPPPARGEGRARDAGRDARLPLPGSAGARRWEESARPRAELQALRAPKFLKSPLPLPLPVKHAAMPPRKKLQGPRAPKFPKSPLPLPLPVKPVATPPRKKRGARPAAKQPPSPPRQKQGARPAAKQPPSPPPPPEPSGPDAPVEEKLRWSIDQEFILRKAAIRAIQAAETESVLSRLHLVRSYMSKEQLETPALQFFQENLPNVSVVRNEEQGELELKWKNWDDIISGDQRDDKVSRPSLATAAGFHFSGDSVQKNFIESSFVLNNFNWSELPESQTIGAPDSLQISGATTSRLSFGMTPKSVRQPKNGEMLLSLHGSPLGMYKEENLAAITESGNGSKEQSHDAAGHQ